MSVVYEDDGDEWLRLTGSALLQAIADLSAGTDVVRGQLPVRDVSVVAVNRSVTSLEERLVVGRRDGRIGCAIVVAVAAERLGGVRGGGISRATAKRAAVTWSSNGRASQSDSNGKIGCENHRACRRLRCR